ncbi:hypothetical protein KF840_06580 [bacterium]|nr:hypothetical protein [bacterium]
MTYLDAARERAKRRKSPWNLLLPVAVLAVWIPTLLLTLVGIDRIHRLLYPEQSLPAQPGGVAVLLATLPVVLGTIPVALFVGNVLVWFVPPARRVLDAEATAHPGTSFAPSQRALLKLSAWSVPPTFALSALGALLPW